MGLLAAEGGSAGTNAGGGAGAGTITLVTGDDGSEDCLSTRSKGRGGAGGPGPEPVSPGVVAVAIKSGNFFRSSRYSSSSWSTLFSISSTCANNTRECVSVTVLVY